MVHRNTWHCKLCCYSINAAHQKEIHRHIKSKHPKAKPKKGTNYFTTESKYGHRRHGQITDRKGKPTTFKKSGTKRPNYK